MSVNRLTPDEMARLLALPENHPDRRAAAVRPEFEAYTRLLEEFVAPSRAPLPAGELAGAARELELRMEGAIRPPGASAARSPRPSWFASLTAALTRPAPRAAFAIAALVVVAGSATWLMTREESPRAVRSAPQAAAIGIAEPLATPGGLELEWTAVPGADGYRVIFYGKDLTELSRVDRVTGTKLELRADSLPAGLARGSEVLAEVTALSGADPIAVSSPRLVRLK